MTRKDYQLRNWYHVPPMIDESYHTLIATIFDAGELRMFRGVGTDLALALFDLRGNLQRKLDITYDDAMDLLRPIVSLSVGDTIHGYLRSFDDDIPF